MRLVQSLSEARVGEERMDDNVISAALPPDQTFECFPPASMHIYDSRGSLRDTESLHELAH